MYMGMTNFAPIRASQLYHREGSGSVRRYLETLAWKFGTLLLLLFLLINLNAASITRSIYGNDYPDLGNLLLGFSIIYAVPLVSDILGFWALAVEATNVIFASLAAMTGFAVVSAYPLVAIGGTSGVLLGFFLAELVRAVVLIVAIRLNSRP